MRSAFSTVFSSVQEEPVDKSGVLRRPRAGSHDTVSTACESNGPAVRDFHVALDVCIGKNSRCSNLKLSDFKDVSPFSEGTNAVLYKAKANMKFVVIKMIKKTVQENATVVREFELEKSILENTDHPNIVRYLGSGYEPRRFVVMEYINQGTLGTVSNTNVSFEVALQRAKQLASAMHYLHELCAPGVTVIHRDLKPDNIGLSDGCIKLFDFGLSICVKRRASLEETYEMTGATGTLRYMAPEVALHRPYNEKVDVYSFGVLLWQMASQRIPYRKANRVEFMDYVVRNGCRPPLLPLWPEQFRTLLETCWDPDPILRPSFAQIVVMLDAVPAYMSELLPTHTAGPGLV